jgi:regulator of protease activity HflC (stomatin/prohibitin superfamily)
MDIITVGIILLVLLVLALKGVKILRPYEKGVVERLGKYQRTVGSGLVVIMPFIETIRKVDLREQVVMYLHRRLSPRITPWLLWTVLSSMK